MLRIFRAIRIDSNAIRLIELLMKKHVVIESVSINYKYENEVNHMGQIRG